MATAEKQNINKLRLTNTILAALGMGLYDMLGDSAQGLSTQFGESILKTMEDEMGLELHGDSVDVWAAEIGRLYVDEFAAGTGFNVKGSADSVYVEALGCMFQHACDEMTKVGTPLFVCPVRAVCAAALKRLELKMRLGEIKRDGDKCFTTFAYV